jgi:hypothetical protein
MDERLEKEFEKGNIVYLGVEGPMTCPLEDFIAQPVDGILYDLNRLEEVVCTFMPDPKWVNDYAVAKTIRALKGRIEELEDENSELAQVADRVEDY